MITYVTYSQLIEDTRLLVKSLPSSVVSDLAGVVGIPRSGMLPASLVASQLHILLADTESFLVNGQQFPTPGCRVSSRPRGGTVLVIDDSVYAGASMDRVRHILNLVDPRYKYVYAAVYRNPEKEPQLDYFAKDIPSPRYFEWNIIQHPHSVNFMFDMDGIICYDPEPFDDGGHEYEQAIINAVSFHLPKRRIHAICTMRLERWRDITEHWLARHEVTFENLHMANFETPEDRRRVGRYGQHKGSIYKNSQESNLFIESNSQQAKQIAEYSGKPVICLTTGEVFQ